MSLEIYITGTVFNETSGVGVTGDVVPIIWTNLMCVGNEESITNCSYTELDENHDCRHTTNIIVDCYRMFGCVYFSQRVHICFIIFYSTRM